MKIGSKNPLLQVTLMKIKLLHLRKVNQVHKEEAHILQEEEEKEGDIKEEDFKVEEKEEQVIKVTNNVTIVTSIITMKENVD